MILVPCKPEDGEGSTMFDVFHFCLFVLVELISEMLKNIAPARQIGKSLMLQ
jgi:hypothetical protein